MRSGRSISMPCNAFYADDLVMTGVLGEPTCGKAAIIDEAKRGITQRQAATASG
jgi:hypothetical protein